MSSITRAIVIAVQLALFATAAHAQVISTWDGGTLWDDPENWNHSVPQAEGNWPKNGNGGLNYSVVINTPANALLASFEPVELNNLSLSGVGRFISGGSDLIILGSSSFEGIAGFNGGGGHFFPNAGVTVNSGEFHLRGWDMDTDLVTLGSGTLGRMLLFEGANVKLDGSLVLNFDSAVTGQASTKLTMNNGSITRPTGMINGAASISVPLDMQGGTIQSAVGELRFGPVFGFSPDQPVITLASTAIQTGGEQGTSLVRFDGVNMNVTGTLSLIDGAEVEFKDAKVQTAGNIVGSGRLRHVGSNGVITGGGTVNLPVLGFVQDGGSIADFTNTGKYEWRSGIIEGGTFINTAAGELAVAPNQSGTRLVRSGKFINEGKFTHQAGSILLGENGEIRNTGEWVATASGGTGPFGLVPHLVGDPPVGFTNTGTFTSFVSYTVNVPFSNTGVVHSVISTADGGITFREGTVEQYNAETGVLSGGTWKTSFGKIIFEGAERLILQGTLVTVDGSQGSFEPLTKLTENHGTVEIRGTRTEIFTPDDGIVDNESSGLFSVGDSVLATEGDTGPATITLPQFNNSGDLVVFGGAILNATVGVDLNGGRLGGDDGNIVTPIVNNIAGVINPGMLPDESNPTLDTTGTLNIHGTYIQHSEGTLVIELAGVNFNQYDTLAITSSTVAGTVGPASASLDGTLQVSLVNNFAPQIGDSFTILTADSIIGEFTTLDLPTLAAGQLEVTYEGNAVVIEVIPAAGSIADMVSSDTFQPPPDGAVDGADLAFLLGEWGRVSAGGSPADIVTSTTFQPPGDGQVDGADLAYLLGEWTG